MTTANEEKRGQDLIDKACSAYGVDKKYLLGSRYYAETDEAVIVTNGGRKVRYKEGDKVEQLSHTEVTGEKPKGGQQYLLGRLVGLQGRTTLGTPRPGEGIKYKDCDLYNECQKLANEKKWKEFNCGNCP
jgi:hypothetical protein